MKNTKPQNDAATGEACDQQSAHPAEQRLKLIDAWIKHINESDDDLLPREPFDIIYRLIHLEETLDAHREECDLANRQYRLGRCAGAVGAINWVLGSEMTE